eukprot:9249122-Alexandrium_andersonii.AAC.1
MPACIGEARHGNPARARPHRSWPRDPQERRPQTRPCHVQAPGPRRKGWGGQPGVPQHAVPQKLA